MVTKSALIAAAALSAVGMAVPLEERQNCASQWGQCGGNNYSGPTCCAAGSVCTYQNDWYSQCLPGNGPTTTTTRSTSSSSSTSSRSTSSSSSTTSRSSSSSSSVSTTSTSTRTTSTTVTGTSPTGTGGATYSGNPSQGVQQWANEYYASEVLNLAVPQMTGAAAAAASKVAEVPSFMRMDTRSKIPLVGEALANIREANQAGASPPCAGIFVVYDLPDRDCAAAASNGEYAIADGGVAKYKAYIDEIREMLIEYSDTRVILAIEPDSLANLVTNLDVPKCANAKDAYLECTDYALRNLNLPNVAMYMDAGHAGWLGWPANLPGTAKLFSDVWKNAGKPKALRGLATNVSNYNAFNISSPPSYTSPNPNYDEKHYIEALRPELIAQGWEAFFITDQGRSGKQPTGQLEWGHWCNAIGTGFGPRPTSNTGFAYQDAFVWIKPGGECDGTSDTSAARYDHNCGLPDALKPAPEAGTWFQAYFEQLLTNANPAF